MSRITHILSIVLVLGLSVWLLTWEQAARPGEISESHSGVAACADCHETWKGVSEENCKGCHFFADPLALHPRVRFHMAEEYCLDCHTEHRGENALSRMDHAILNPDLECGVCHLDAHRGKFGEDCRECHGLTSWNVAGFKHPLEERRNCGRCHATPLSHEHEGFWDVIEERHMARAGGKEPSVEECWRCHITHDWRHLRM